MNGLFPADKREWAEALAAQGGTRRAMVKLLVVAWALTLKGERSMRTVVTTLSIVNLLAGLGMIALTAATEAPWVVTALAGVLIAQGGYTLLVLAGARFASHRLVVVGETLAVVGGGGAFLLALVDSIGAVDPEYGPIAVAGLITAHAVAGLSYYAVRSGSESSLR